MTERNPLRLLVLCMDQIISTLDRNSMDLYSYAYNPFEDLGAFLCESLLQRAYKTKKIWRSEWKLFLTPKIRSVVICWQEDIVRTLEHCTVLKIVEVINNDENFNAELLQILPKSCAILDFDGSLSLRGSRSMLDFDENIINVINWLPQAEHIFRQMKLYRTKMPDISKMTQLTEVHLGAISVTASDLMVLLKLAPNLKLLRHYQMVKALYELHVKEWKSKMKLPTYKVKNLDVDFSHVIRHRMSPEWVLCPDALQLAVQLCPHAESLRLRFDCSTPNDVLIPVTSLAKLREFSAVCVSSGERTLLDFTDIVPILEKFGPTTLTCLELKFLVSENVVEYETTVEDEIFTTSYRAIDMTNMVEAISKLSS